MKPIFKELAKDVAISLAIALCITAVVKPTIVRGTSMEPTFYEGDYLLVSRIAYSKEPPQRGDVVVLKESNRNDSMSDRYLIKRVCAVGGDEITVNALGVNVNGIKVEEKYISDDGVQEEKTETWNVPTGTVFVMGDHRSASLDSRSPDVGYVKEADIVGRVVLRLWPLSRMGLIHNPFE